MPTSFLSNIPAIVEVIVAQTPKNVLDIGPGYGKYGALVQEYTDANVDAVEVFEPYVKDFKLKGKYRKVTIGNGIEADTKGYDLVLLIDVIEHWDKEPAKEFLKRATANGSSVLVSTPRGFFPQDAVNGNEWERHLSGWNSPDLDEFSFTDYSTQHSFIWLIHARV